MKKTKNVCTVIIGLVWLLIQMQVFASGKKDKNLSPQGKPAPEHDFSNHELPPLPPDMKDGSLPPPPGMDGEQAVDYTGVVTVATSEAEVDPEKDTQILEKEITSTNSDESAVLIKSGGAELSGAVIVKRGDATAVNQSNFTGVNAAVVATGGSWLQMSDVGITTEGEGANAIVATGKGTVVSVKDVQIATTKNSSRGLHATYQGSIIAENVTISTKGAHCAGLATDRGEGTVVLNKGSVQTEGEGSPVIYSTGNITAAEVSGTAKGSEIAVVEGKNTIVMDHCTLSGTGPHGIMLYQSFSGDADIGKSVLSIKDCALTSDTTGPFFYITNTNAKIDLTKSDIQFTSGVLLKASGNNGERGWGMAGSNGGSVTLKAYNQKLAGDIECDRISTVTLELGDAAEYTGTINSAKQGCVGVKLTKTAQWIVTSDSYIGSLSDTDSTYSNIISHGHTIYYDSSDAANAYLQQRIVTLPDGGQLVPYIAEHPVIEKKTSKMSNRPPHGKPMGQPPAHFN